MTPAILVDCLRREDMTMDRLALLVFDEAHHAYNRHPYMQVMDYYWRLPQPDQRPHVFGMTACPVNVGVRCTLLVLQPVRTPPGLAIAQVIPG
jgi:ERCC4-related helicase